MKRNLFLMIGTALLLGLGIVMLTLGASEANICAVVGYQYRVCGDIGRFFVLGSIDTVIAFVLLFFVKEKGMTKQPEPPPPIDNVPFKTPSPIDAGKMFPMEEDTSEEGEEAGKMKEEKKKE